MFDFLDVNSIFFTTLGYSVSYLEFFGTFTYFASVWLIARKNFWTWPVGILSVLLYMALFYQFQLYSDALEQVYYLVASGFGWWFWGREGSRDKIVSLFSSRRQIVVTAIGTLVAGLALGYFMSNVHLILPDLFPMPASFPYLDAVTTIASFTAMWLLTLKRTESWVYWILVDIAAIYLYFTKGIAFVGLQYIALLGLAIHGLLVWGRGTPTGKRSTEASEST